MACGPSSRSASMLTSSRLAPPRTCSRATSTAAWLSSASISRRNLAEPATLVRSPIITNPVSGPISKVSSPLNLVLVRAGGMMRGGSPATAAAMWATCSGVVPQQRRCLGRLLVIAAERVGQAGVRVAADIRASQPGKFLDMRAHLGRAERAVHPDYERLRMLHRGPEGLDRLPGQRSAG